MFVCKYIYTYIYSHISSSESSKLLPHCSRGMASVPVVWRIFAVSVCFQSQRRTAGASRYIGGHANQPTFTICRHCALSKRYLHYCMRVQLTFPGIAAAAVCGADIFFILYCSVRLAGAHSASVCVRFFSGKRCQKCDAAPPIAEYKTETRIHTRILTDTHTATVCRSAGFSQARQGARTFPSGSAFRVGAATRAPSPKHPTIKA